LDMDIPQTVYLLWHGDDLDDTTPKPKLLGVYSSESLAEDRIERSSETPGFRQHPDTFHVQSFVVDEDKWVEGYVVVERILVELLDEGVQVWRPVAAEALSDGMYRLPPVTPEGEHWVFPPGTVVRCERRGNDLIAVEAEADQQ